MRACWPVSVAWPSVGMTTQVLVAEDSALMREGMRLLFDTQPDLALVGACGDLDGLLEHASRLRPDVVITDIRMPPTHTMRASGPPRHYARPTRAWVS